MNFDQDARIPQNTAGRRIGLLGGSFNPPHDGHRHVALTALKRLRLDYVWCLVSPGNPLKETDGLPSLARRLDAVRAVMDHPRIIASGLEAGAGTRYTVDTLAYLIARRPRARFVWLIGADNLADLHLWRNWPAIFDRIPVAVIDRPGAAHAALNAPAARRFAGFRLPERDCGCIADQAPPAWVFVHGPLNHQSSTALRRLRAER